MRSLAPTLLLSFVAACTATSAKDGSSEGTGGSGGGASKTDRFVAAMHQFQCEYLTCVDGFSAAADCLVSDASDEALSKSLAAGRQKLDAAKAEACIATTTELDGRACWGASDVGRTKMAVAVAACLGALNPAVAVGGACFDGAECAGGYCDLTACPGTCRELKQSGGKCANGMECTSGTECLGYDAPRCTVVGAKGASCDDDSPCATGLECFQARCAEPYVAEPGGNCVRDANCGPGALCEGLQVDNGGNVVVYGRCSVKGAFGAPCETAGGFFIASPDCAGAQVCAGLVLESGGAATTGKCALPADVGGRCYPASALSGGGADGCYLGLLCDPKTERCVLPPKAGAACVDDKCAAGAYCDGSTCVPMKKPGEACRSSSECAWSCDDGKCSPVPDGNPCRAP